MVMIVKEYQEKACLVCGKIFTPVSSTQLYCCKKCRVIAGNNARQERRKLAMARDNKVIDSYGKSNFISSSNKCNREDCLMYDPIFYNNCSALDEIDIEYIKACSFYKHK